MIPDTMCPPLITLTTDFGSADGYVAQMKGVLRGLVPEAVIDDLAHDIPAHNVWAGALFLEGAIPRYPAGSVHVVVVDPGVGTQRRPMVASWRDRLVVCPDNGLLTLLWRREGAGPIYEIGLPCAVPGVPDVLSATFHGRDLFAPVAAFLARGGRPEHLGSPLADPVRLPFPEPLVLEDGIVVGQVIHVDRFGNAVTNMDRQLFPPEAAAGAVRIGLERAPEKEMEIRLVRTYGDIQPGELAALINSGDRLELATHADSAARLWNIQAGARVILRAVLA